MKEPTVGLPQEDTIMSRNMKILVLDRKLVDTIDRNRGELNRTEFIEYCIYNCIGETAHERRAEPGEPFARSNKLEFYEQEMESSSASVRDEFLDFKHDVRELIKALLEFFIAFSLGTGRAADNDDILDLKNQIRSVLKD